MKIKCWQSPHYKYPDTPMEAVLVAWRRFGAIGIAIHEIDKRDVKEVLTFGAGLCYYENEIHHLLDRSVKIRPTELDEIAIEKANQWFPHLDCRKFDMTTDNLEDLCLPEMVMLFGVFACLSDTEMISFIRDLKSTGVKTILSFEGATVSIFEILYRLYRNLYSHAGWLANLCEGPIYPHRLHIGWKRTWRHVQKLYRLGGWELEKRYKCIGYKYVGVYKPSR